MKKQVRWKCERCEDGLLAPSKPRLDDVRRYCLPCSSETGKLVERIAPALEAQRITAKQKYQKKVAKRKQIERSLDAVVRDRRKARKALVAHVEKEAAKIWEMMLEIQSEIPARYRLPHHYARQSAPRIEFGVSRTGINGSGHAWVGSHRIRLVLPHRVQSDRSWHLLVHELAHCAVGVDEGNSHPEQMYQLMKEVYRRRWKIDISFGMLSGNRWGYEVDDLMEAQAVESGMVKWQVDAAMVKAALIKGGK